MKPFVITPQQFIDENYKSKIERGACEVFMPYRVPSTELDEMHRWAYEELLRIAPKGSAVKSVTKNEDESFDVHTIPSGIMLVNAKTQLHVWLK